MSPFLKNTLKNHQFPQKLPTAIRFFFLFSDIPLEEQQLFVSFNFMSIILAVLSSLVDFSSGESLCGEE